MRNLLVNLERSAHDACAAHDGRAALVERAEHASRVERVECAEPLQRVQRPHTRVLSGTAKCLLIALLSHGPLQGWGQPRLQAPPDAVAPGTIPLMPKAQPPVVQEDQGQSSTGGTQVRSERIQQLIRIAMSSPKDSPKSSTGSAMSPGQASWLLGLLYLHGQGVALNAAQAEHWFVQAWSQHERLASAGLAWCALEGCSGPANPAQARRWIEALRAQQPGRAQYLSWLLARKLAPVDAMSTARGKPAPDLDALLRKAVAMGDVQAHAAVGRQLFAQHRFAQALQAFNAAAPHSPAASRNVELVKARMALESAPNMNTPPRPALDPEAIYLQARRLHRGEGIPANYTEAMRLYLLADRLGHREARKMLALIYSRPLPSGEVDVGWMRQLADLDISLPSPRMAPASHALILHEDATPLMDWVPMAWR